MSSQTPCFGPQKAFTKIFLWLWPVQDYFAILGWEGWEKFFPQTNHHPPLSPMAENVMTRNWNAHAPVDNARHADWLNGNERKESDRPSPSPDNNKFRTNPLSPWKKFSLLTYFLCKGKCVYFQTVQLHKRYSTTIIQAVQSKYPAFVKLWSFIQLKIRQELKNDQVLPFLSSYSSEVQATRHILQSVEILVVCSPGTAKTCAWQPKML